MKKTVGVLFGVGILIFLGIWSVPVLNNLSRPDVDELIRRQRYATTAGESARHREELLALGQPGVVRLREISQDQTRDPEDRALAVWLLTANPEAVSDFMRLVDDPEPAVRTAARSALEACLIDDSSQTEPDTSLSPIEVFDRWSRDNALSTSSPYFLVLKSMGRPATEAILVVAEDDSPLRRRSAYIAIGMLGDTSAIPALQKLLKRPHVPSDITGIRIALTMLGE